MSIKVSIVVPTYKRPALLIKCLHHLAQQNFAKENFEVIVVTDGTDNTTKNEINFFSRQHLFFNLSCYSLSQKKRAGCCKK